MRHVTDAVPIGEAEIRGFAQENNILVRYDHMGFLIKFGGKSDKRAEIFKEYGGDFDFENLKWVYEDEEIEMEPPPGTVFFGSNFAGHALCVAADTGKIYLYHSAKRYGIVHASIDGFLLGCMLSLYHKDAFADVVVRRDMTSEHIDAFRLANADKKLIQATGFDLEFENIDNPKVREEYYLIGRNLVAIYPGSGSLATMSGGVLDRLD